MDESEIVGFTSDNLKRAHESGKEIILTNEDKKRIYESFQRSIDKSSDNILTIKFLLIGTILGIVGGFISQGAYEFIKEKGINWLTLSIFLSIMIFILLIIMIIIYIFYHRYKIKEDREIQETWSGVKSLLVS